jgi:hypothetical protein
LCALHEWDQSHEPSDPAIFKEQILPGLQGIPLRVMADATALSVQHCGWFDGHPSAAPEALDHP